MTTCVDIIERGKSLAAKMAVYENINESCIVGIGSGSTVTYVLDHLVRRTKELDISIKCIPTSYQSEDLIRDHNLPLTDLHSNPVIDITIDGADEVDRNLVAIKGGGACLLQEKRVAFAAKKFVVVADYRKKSEWLGQSWTKGIPIEVVPKQRHEVKRRISEQFKSHPDNIVIRLAREKAGPVITDNGNVIIDWKYPFDQARDFSSDQWIELSNKINNIHGVLETGIFGNVIKRAYFGGVNGEVDVRFA